MVAARTRNALPDGRGSDTERTLWRSHGHGTLAGHGPAPPDLRYDRPYRTAKEAAGSWQIPHSCQTPLSCQKPHRDVLWTGMKSDSMPSLSVRVLPDFICSTACAGL